MSTMIISNSISEDSRSLHMNPTAFFHASNGLSRVIFDFRGLLFGRGLGVLLYEVGMSPR